jgi:hypothetical protein
MTVMLAGIALIGGGTASAQNARHLYGASTHDREPVNEGAPTVQRDLRSMKKQIIAANVGMTDEEAQAFWPIYDRYSAEWTPLMDAKFRLMKQYIDNLETMTDDQADEYIRQREEVEEALQRLRVAYMPEFRKALSARTAALFLQLDWRISLFVDMRLALELPLIDI